MSKYDYLSIDGRALRLLLTVLDEGSVTGAAERLGTTQSAVSHTLEKLRAITGDPLFVKAGRGIVATAHAQSLAKRSRMLLDDMKALASAPQFDPASAALNLTVAVNDFERDLLLPAFFQRLSHEAPNIRLRVVPSGARSLEMLRDDRCDLLITPRPPTGGDIIQKRLLQDRYVCFYDSEVRSAPKNLQEYLEARHVSIMFDDVERIRFDRELETQKIQRNIVLTVPNFSGVSAFLRGSDMIASLPSLLCLESLQGFKFKPLPLEYPNLILYMAWHKRNHIDLAHRWLRSILESETSAKLLASDLTWLGGQSGIGQRQ